MIDRFFLIAALISIVILVLNLVVGRSLLQGHLKHTRKASPGKYWRLQLILAAVAAVSLLLAFLPVFR